MYVTGSVSICDRQCVYMSQVVCICVTSSVYCRVPDFQELFPDRDLAQDVLTVITISQKTQQDMSGWSCEVEKEREDLLSTVRDSSLRVRFLGYFLLPLCHEEKN